MYEKSTANWSTLLWKVNCPCYTLPPIFSSSGHHSDGVACVALDVSESGLSCCWVTELQGGLTVVVLKQLGAGPELVHFHATLTLEAFMTSAVTSVGVGGAGGDI